MIVTLQNVEEFKGRKYSHCCGVHGSSLPVTTTGPSALKLSELIPGSRDRFAQALPVAVLNTLAIVGILGKHREQLGTQCHYLPQRMYCK